jgi:drug/metabolite transporter (DMT)-like permease
MLRRLADKAFNNAYLLLTLLAIFWAGNQIIGRAVAGHVPPVALSFLRWSLATVFLFPFALPYLKRDWPVVRENWKFLAVLGVIGGGAFNTLQYIGLNFTTALNGLVLNSTAPILIALSCVVLFKDKMSPKQIVGTIVSLLGVLIVISRGDLDVLVHMTLNRGDLLILFGMLITGIYTAYLRLRPNIHWVTFLFAQFLASGLFNLPLVIIESTVFGLTLQPTLVTFLAVMYVSIFPSIIGYILYTRGVELIGGVRAGIFLHLVPFFGALMAIGLLGEPLAAFHIAGFVLILTGVAMTSRKP